MNLQQAIDAIETFAVEPDDLPSPGDWNILEEAARILQSAVASGSTLGHSKSRLIDLMRTGTIVVAIAKAGGYNVVIEVLADERVNVFNWLEEILNAETSI